MIDWKPIATAPKDGTEILTYVEVATVPVVHLSWWRQLEDNPEFTDEDVGFWTYPEHSVTQVKLEDWTYPTHWCEYNAP